MSLEPPLCLGLKGGRIAWRGVNTRTCGGRRNDSSLVVRLHTAQKCAENETKHSINENMGLLSGPHIKMLNVNSV